MKKIIKYIYLKIPFKKQLFQLIKPLRLPASVYKHLYFNDTFEVQVAEKKFKMQHYGFQIENEVFWSGLTNGWEKISIQLWIALCKESNTIIDVGANTGIYALIAKTLHPTAAVYCFEPVHRVFEKLIHNCTLNNYQIACFETALSNYDGEAIIFDTASEHTYSVTVNKNTTETGTNTIETKIRTQKLATFIVQNNIQHIDLIKIDVETHEAEVLEGMETYLQQFQPTLLIEILNDEVGKRVQELIKNIDYLYFNIDEINKPKKVDRICKSNYYNYLICKKEIAIKLKLI
jgi:FkbM family methyltransferase